VSLAKKIFVLGMVVFWTLVTNHCSLEDLPVLEFLACSTPAEASPHQPSDCGDTDACAAVEDGLYKTEESKVSAKKVAFTPDSFALALLCNIIEPESSRNQVAPGLVPLELSRIWQFSLRTALPARAPSVLS
jgi:hypothetical protein